MMEKEKSATGNKKLQILNSKNIFLKILDIKPQS